MSNKRALSRYQLLNDKKANTYEKEVAPSTPSGKDVGLENYGSGKLSIAEERHNTEMADIDRRHREAVRQQAQQRADSKREAYIAHERLQKYLPQVQAAAGTGGMGMSETAKVQGLNAYLGQRSAADAAYASGVSELEASKQAAERESLQRYLDTKEAVEAERSAAVGSMVGSKAAAYQGADGKLSLEDYQKLSDYVEQNRHHMTPDDQVLMDLTLEGYREQVRTDAEQMAVDNAKLVTKGATFEGISDFKDNKNLVIKAGGAAYKVQLNAPGDTPVTDADVLAAGGQVNSGAIFGFGNKLYLKHNGDVYAIEARDNSYKEDYDTLYKLFFDGGTGKGGDKVQTLEAYGSGSSSGRTVMLNGERWMVSPDGRFYPANS